ncbi:MAG: hypothetical protein ACKERG_03695 [Candidatus Hodgkinia cicadicola]
MEGGGTGEWVGAVMGRREERVVSNSVLVVGWMWIWVGCVLWVGCGVGDVRWLLFLLLLPLSSLLLFAYTSSPTPFLFPPPSPTLHLSPFHPTLLFSAPFLHLPPAHLTSRLRPLTP